MSHKLFCDLALLGLLVSMSPASVMEPAKATAPSSDSAFSRDLKHECELLDLEFPLRASALQVPAATAYAEIALERAISAYTNTRAFVAISGNAVTITLQERQYALWTGGSIEAFRAQLPQYSTKPTRLTELGNQVKSQLPGLFLGIPSLNVSVQVSELAGSSVTCEVRIIPGNDMIGEVISGGKVNYRRVWDKIIGIIQAEHIPIDTVSYTNYKLRTVVEPSKDPDWLYQSFTEVTLSDPMAGNPREAGLRSEIRVVRNVRRCKERGEWKPWDVISGSNERKLLDTIQRQLTKED